LGEESGFYFNTWIDIIVSYSVGANIIVLFESEDDDELMEKMENDLCEKLVVNYVRFLPVNLKDSSTKHTNVKRAVQYSLKNKMF
jgi:hypothetical protein